MRGRVKRAALYEVPLDCVIGRLVQDETTHSHGLLVLQTVLLQLAYMRQA